MKVEGFLVDWLIELDLKVSIRDSRKKVLYLEVLRAMYGMLVASLLCYRNIRNGSEVI